MRWIVRQIPRATEGKYPYFIWAGLRPKTHTNNCCQARYIEVSPSIGYQKLPSPASITDISPRWGSRIWRSYMNFGVRSLFGRSDSEMGHKCCDPPDREGTINPEILPRTVIDSNATSFHCPPQTVIDLHRLLHFDSILYSIVSGAPFPSHRHKMSSDGPSPRKRQPPPPPAPRR